MPESTDAAWRGNDGECVRASGRVGIAPLRALRFGFRRPLPTTSVGEAARVATAADYAGYPRSGDRRVDRDTPLADLMRRVALW